MDVGISINILSEDDAARIEKARLVPVYRVRYKQRRFMGWALRNDSLRGATQIRFEGDEMGGNGEAVVVYSKSDA
jgi:hypothetical protein